MATVEAKSDIELGRSTIGWDGRRLDEMLTESERLFADTGYYFGLHELTLMASDPDRLREALLPHPRRSRLGARDSAQHLCLADRA